MLMGLVQLLSSGSSGVPSDLLTQRVDLLTQEVSEGLGVLEKNGLFTENGAAFTDWAHEMISQVKTVA